MITVAPSREIAARRARSSLPSLTPSRTTRGLGPPSSQHVHARRGRRRPRRARTRRAALAARAAAPASGARAMRAAGLRADALAPGGGARRSRQVAQRGESAGARRPEDRARGAPVCVGAEPQLRRPMPRRGAARAWPRPAAGRRALPPGAAASAAPAGRRKRSAALGTFSTLSRLSVTIAHVGRHAGQQRGARLAPRPPPCR